MPFHRKTENSNSPFRKKTRKDGDASFLRGNLCDSDGERVQKREQKRNKNVDSARLRGQAQARVFAARPYYGHQTVSPRPSPQRFRRGSDQFSYASPVEASSSPTGRKTAGFHCPGSNNAKNLREYISNSIWNAKISSVCCATQTESQTPSPAGSMEPVSHGAPFVRPVNVARDLNRRYYELDAYAGDEGGRSSDEKTTTQGTRNSSSPKTRRCCKTPEMVRSRENILFVHSPYAEPDTGRTATTISTGKWARSSFDDGNVFKKCQFLEAEVEYLRDRDIELRERFCREQSETRKLADEMRTLNANYRDALTAKRRLQETCAEQHQSIKSLEKACNEKADELKQLKLALNRERMQWMESVRRLQDDLEKEKRRQPLFRSNSAKTSVYTDTDTDISLNDFFEDGTPTSSNFPIGQSSSSLNNSPGVSPRTLDVIRAENKKLLDENKKLRAECEELETCRKVYHQQQHVDALKQEGNKAFQAGNYDKALRCYSEALERVDDLHLKAVLHCNKATALFNMDRFLETIISCCSALDCDGSYLRAYQRRASAYEAINDIPSATDDLTQLISTGGNSTIAREAQLHLSELTGRSKTTRPVDAYKILGLSMSATLSQVKSKYRKLALQFHPDKALDSAGASEAFRLVSNAYALLSDEAKKCRFDVSWLRSSRSPRKMPYSAQ